MIIDIIYMALIPVILLTLYILYRDRERPEPVWLLAIAFFLGIFSCFASFVLSVPAEMVGLYTDEPSTVLQSICTSFFGAAIPEEAAKLTMLWLVLRCNRHFDERLDGIVYAALVSLGFAAFENIIYLFDNADIFLYVGISRGIFSVPLHFCCGILMGYYYSRGKFGTKKKKFNMAMSLIVPVLVHGIFDSMLFASRTVDTNTSIIIFLTFVVFCILIWIISNRQISKLKKEDKECLPVTEWMKTPPVYIPVPSVYGGDRDTEGRIITPPPFFDTHICDGTTTMTPPPFFATQTQEGIPTVTPPPFFSKENSATMSMASPPLFIGPLTEENDAISHEDSSELQSGKNNGSDVPPPFNGEE
jgi:RsiW-degrading membrane proteinase PrsW (M82 family)